MAAIRQALNIAELRQAARRRVPRFVFDYIDGGADDEVTLARNSRRFDDYQLYFRTLVDVSRLHTATAVMGAPCALPMLLAPAAGNRLFHPPAGECAVAAAAQARGIIYSTSTLATVPVEEIARHSRGPKWFQIYVWRDRELVTGILERIRAAGFSGIILTVDLAVAGNRERDPRNRFTVPPKPSLSLAAQLLSRPRYLWDIATSPKIEPANFPPPPPGLSVSDFIDSQFDHSVDWAYARWLKEAWGGPLAIKGISTAADAQRAVEIGADCVWVSNHGGRQLDTSPASIDLLPDIVAAVGEQVDIVLDGGIRRGHDVVKALALGAKAVGIGRPYLYGLAAAGQAGVERALQILQAEFERTLALIGCPDIRELHPGLLRLPP